ncbi:hypothetical protein [Pseudomonas parafulva]|uniref:hypothetical protein n=1 Tax=Pseudomonas parafulva TaxID=157782 RepID=UPI00048C3B62|nr:hypothetical protein [Pseudomonas parafulva]
MANTKKQDKPTPVPEQAATAPADQATNSTPGSSHTATAEAIGGGVATTVPSTDPGLGAEQGAGGPATDLPVELASAIISTGDAGHAGNLTSQSGQTAGELHTSPETSGPNEVTSSDSAEVNPAKVKVYPLRSFMDEGELRRRGGPSYLVPRLHAEDLEQRNLVSRTPLEE